MKKKIAIHLDEDVYQRLKATAAREKRSVSELVREGIVMRLRERSRGGLKRFLASKPFKNKDQQFRETMEADFYDQ